MRIQHNIAALNSNRQLATNNSNVSKNLEKLSSGFRINRAGDDAAGLAISEKMRAQIAGLETAQSNAQDGISLVQTAEGALTEVHSMLNRMIELANQSANGTYSDDVDRDNLQNELESLTTEIDRISDGTNFNGITLLDGSLGSYKSDEVTVDANSTGKTAAFKWEMTSTDKDVEVLFTVAAGTKAATATWDPDTTKMTIKIAGKANDQITQDDIDAAIESAAGGYTGDLSIKLTDGSIKLFDDSAEVTSLSTVSLKSLDDAQGLTLQIGDTADNFNKLTVKVGAMNASGLGIDGISISSQSSAQAAIDSIKEAINKVSSTRGDLGAIQNRLEHTINNLSVTSENMTSAESRIRDVDMAKEMMEFTKNNILSQASQSMLAQANQIPQGVLQLLQ